MQYTVFIAPMCIAVPHNGHCAFCAEFISTSCDCTEMKRNTKFELHLHGKQLTVRIQLYIWTQRQSKESQRNAKTPTHLSTMVSSNSFNFVFFQYIAKTLQRCVRKDILNIKLVQILSSFGLVRALKPHTITFP